MSRQSSYPEGHYKVTVPIPYSMGLRCGDFVSFCGQVDLTTSAEVQNVGDHKAQLERAGAALKSIMRDLDLRDTDLRETTIFYSAKAGAGDEDVARWFKEGWETPTEARITSIAMPYLTYDGMEIEIDPYAIVRDGDGRSVGARSKLVPIGDHASKTRVASRSGRRDARIFLRDALKSVLNDATACGGSAGKIVQLVFWFRDSDPAAFLVALQDECKAAFGDKGPAVSAVPMPFCGEGIASLQITGWVAPEARDGDIVRRRRSDAKRTWPFANSPIPDACEYNDFIFVSLRVPRSQAGATSGDLVQQTVVMMDDLKEFMEEIGSSMDEIIKMNCLYTGSVGTDSYHQSLTRSSYFKPEGPGSTGVPTDRLGIGDIQTIVWCVGHRERE